MSKGVYEELLSLSLRVKESGDASEAMRNSDTESIICIVERLSKILAHFGITTSAPKLDLPKAVADLGQDVRQGLHGVRRDGVHGFYTCECGCGEMMYGIDITKPPPSSNVAAAPAAPSTPVPSATPTAAASSNPSHLSNQSAPCPPALGPQIVAATTAPPSSAPDLPYPVVDTFLKNHHINTTFLFDPANNIAPQGTLMHQQPPTENLNPANKGVPTAPSKRTHDAMGNDLPAKKQC